MPEGLFPWEFVPQENRRKRYVVQGGLGNDLNGHKNPRERQQHICVRCRTRFEYDSQELDFSNNDFGEVQTNLCAECRKVLRTLRTNHPEMKS